MKIVMKKMRGRLSQVLFLIGIAVALMSTAFAAEVLTIATANLPDGAVNTAYSQTISATGGEGAYHWSKAYGFLPAGLTIADSGLIYGTPTVVGNSRFTVRVTDGQNPAANATKTFSITIKPLPLTITTVSLPNGAVRAAYSERVGATGGFIPYSWSISAGSLPAGLVFNASTGSIIGTPKSAGTSEFTVRVTDSQNPADTVTKALSIKIEGRILPP